MQRALSDPTNSTERLRGAMVDVKDEMDRVYEKIHAANLTGEEPQEEEEEKQKEEPVPEEELLRRQGRSSDIASVLVILKAFVGGTLLVLPAALFNSGLVTGTLIFWTVGLLELRGMLKLLAAHRQYGRSFGHLAGMAMGRFGTAAVEASIVLSQLGFAATEMIYVSKNGAFVAHWLLEHTGLYSVVPASIADLDFAAILLCLQLLVVIPVSWLDDLSAFTTFNFLGNSFVLSAIFIISATTVSGLSEEGIASDVKLSCSPRQVLAFAGFSAFAFEGINMVIPMYSAHRNKDTFPRILACTIVGVMVLFTAFGAANVALYGESIRPILTLNLPPTSVVVLLVPFLFATASLVLVVLMAWPVFEVLEDSIKHRSRTLLASPLRLRLFRTALMLLCAGVAREGGHRLDSFLSLVGAIGCVPLAFIYPAVVHLRLVAQSTMEVFEDCLILAVGLCISIACTISESIT